MRNAAVQVSTGGVLLDERDLDLPRRAGIDEQQHRVDPAVSRQAVERLLESRRVEELERGVARGESVQLPGALAFADRENRDHGNASGIGGGAGTSNQIVAAAPWTGRGSFGAAV